MSSPSRERSGVLVIVAWVEGEENPLRARITLVHDVAGDEREIVVAASESQVLDVVRRWLAALERPRTHPS